MRRSTGRGARVSHLPALPSLAARCSSSRWCEYGIATCKCRSPSSPRCSSPDSGWPRPSSSRPPCARSRGSRIDSEVVTRSRSTALPSPLPASVLVAGTLLVALMPGTTARAHYLESFHLGLSAHHGAGQNLTRATAHIALSDAKAIVLSPAPVLGTTPSVSRSASRRSPVTAPSSPRRCRRC